MFFSFIPLTALAVFCTSAAVANLFALLLSKIIRRSLGRHRLSAAALFLSGAVAALALLLIFVPFPGAFSAADAAYYGVIFTLAFFGTLFFRFFGLPLLCVYALGVLGLFLALSSWAGKTPAAYELELTAAAVLLDGKPLPLPENASDEPEKIRLVFAAVRIPPALPVPLKNLWFRPAGLDGSLLPDGETVSVTAQRRPDGSFVERAGFALLAYAEKLDALLAGGGQENVSFYAEIPAADFLPVSYRLLPHVRDGKLSFTITRLL